MISIAVLSLLLIVRIGFTQGLSSVSSAGGGPQTQTYLLDTEGISPLGLAAYNGDLAAAQQLVDKGVDVNERMLGVTALWLAAGGIPRHYYSERYYERADAKTQLEQAVHLAAQTQVLKLLIARGADANAAPPNGTTPLMIAVQNGNLESAVFLLDHGADVNAYTDMGDTALSDAVLRGHPEVVRLVLGHGADINSHDVDGETPLMRTLYQPDIVSLLLDHGAEVAGTSKKTGQNVLTSTVMLGGSQTLRVLLAHGIDPNMQDREGRTALMMAASNGSAVAVQVLMSAKAAVNLKDSKGKTALAYALENHKEDVANLLRQAGALE